MHAFLKRHYKKGASRKLTGRGKSQRQESVTSANAGPIGVLKYHEAVSKSMDSLLMVASSIPLPPNAQLNPEALVSSKKERRRDAPKSSLKRSQPPPLDYRHSDNDLTGMGRRHSFDFSSGKFVSLEDEDAEYDELTDSVSVSHSAESSPVRHAPMSVAAERRRRGLLQRTLSGETYGSSIDSPLRQSMLTSMGTSASQGSERDEYTDSEDDRSFVSVLTSDGESQVFLISEDQEYGAVLSSPPQSHGHVISTFLSAGSALQTKKETLLRQRQNALMEHPFFQLDVQLHEGRDLVVRDSCGTSDPYVKFKIGNKQVYRSKIIFKNLNPKWEETFSIAIDDIHKPITIKVLDYDRGFHDDPMGNSEIDILQLDLGKPNELKLLLTDRGKEEYMGYLVLTCTIHPKTQDDKDQYMRRSNIRPSEQQASKKLKMQTWMGIVAITLVEGVDLVPMDDNGLSDPYVKFRLGDEKYRTKHKSKTLNPRWLEHFDIHMHNDQSTELEIMVFDYDVTGKDDFMGRATIELSKLESESTHHLDVELEDGAGMLKLLLTITGTCYTEALSDLANYTPDSRQRDELKRKYGTLAINNYADLSDIGQLLVKVFKAEGLKSADLGGQSDPFCVLELVNNRVQTHTEYKTLNPEWNKVFNFKVRDIHSVLEVTVFDEDRDKKVEFLGKVAIPILKIRSGERRWYALKDKKLMHRTKGSIHLEMDLVFNHVKAAIRTINPREEKILEVEPKFKINLMKKNIDRVSQLISVFVDGGKFLQSCFSWESTSRSATAFVVFLVMVWNFEIYMLPITLLLIFLKNLLVAQVIWICKREQAEVEYMDEEEEEEDEEKEKNGRPKEEKKSFKEKLQSIQDVCLQVQQGMDMVASLGERVKNTFNWTVPWLTTLVVVTLTAGVIVLYFIPLRLLILAWGIGKFTKKLRKPNAISNNELLDFLSRVPSDRELAQYREFRPELPPTPGKKKRS